MPNGKPIAPSVGVGTSIEASRPLLAVNHLACTCDFLAGAATRLPRLIYTLPEFEYLHCQETNASINFWTFSIQGL
jgi:hypothetical protein